MPISKITPGIDNKVGWAIVPKTSMSYQARTILKKTLIIVIDYVSVIIDNPIAYSY
ncbi:MAG: hypothetical protein KBT05_00720 [Bacteroidales bacterium]|nr:hypothetical protein [Candidatus Cryptobacteroides caccocaballi]